MTTISKEQLIESAQGFSSRALAAYRDGDEPVVLHNAAIALEHLSKAYLYSLHPTLLMDVRNGKLESLLFLAGITTTVPRGMYPRTISAREALARVQAVLPGLQTPKAPLNQLIDIRDGQLHVGFLASAPTYEVLAAFLRYSNELYDAMGVALEDRWGEHDEMITHLISESTTEIERAVQVRLSAAWNRLQSWIERVPDEGRASVCAARQAAASPANLAPDEEYEISECPGCGDQDAYRLGKIQLEWDVDVEPGDLPGEVDVTPFLVRRFWPRQFRCGVCELRLNGPEEMGAAGLPVDEEVTSTDPRDYPDEADEIMGEYR
ncbi:MAG TPA: hypothetical protein VGL93_17085 [Streptosporangiaceae bacterium]